MVLILLVILSFVAYKILIKRYNKNKRPYLIEDEAIKIINSADVSEQSSALRTVYKKKKNYKLVSKFNCALAKEIYLIKKDSEVKEK